MITDKRKDTLMAKKNFLMKTREKTLVTEQQLQAQKKAYEILIEQTNKLLIDINIDKVYYYAILEEIDEELIKG